MQTELNVLSGFRQHGPRTLADLQLPMREDNLDALDNLEHALAEVHWTKEENRNPVATYNRKTLDELKALAPDYHWEAAMEAGIGKFGKLFRRSFGRTVCGKVLFVWMFQEEFTNRHSRLRRKLKFIS